MELVPLTDTDLISRIRNTEDPFVERKSISDIKGWVKTIVAFANSTPIGYPSVLYIGVEDGGKITPHARNLEDSLKSLTNSVKEHVYPEIYFTPRIIKVEGQELIAVIVPGSELRPHFYGHAYVREGTESVKASEAKYREFIAKRSGKVNELLRWVGKPISVINVQRVGTSRYESTWSNGPWTVKECREFWVELGQMGAGGEFCISLSSIELNWDVENKRLKLEYHQV